MTSHHIAWLAVGIGARPASHAQRRLHRCERWVCVPAHELEVGAQRARRNHLQHRLHPVEERQVGNRARSTIQSTRMAGGTFGAASACAHKTCIVNGKRCCATPTNFVRMIVGDYQHEHNTLLVATVQAAEVSVMIDLCVCLGAMCSCCAPASPPAAAPLSALQAMRAGHSRRASVPVTSSPRLRRKA